ncbi:gamma-glutamyl-gamma-aminobutyrate hydrolase family protein [Halobacillus seohaensis]|uniref:Gamma-glutamyl-gamma-aminobutyrate hydrolase family protein n=1 Tax=Halobacillus seohaensis TaxID=447421 RepID=A0ABW2EGP7_9BACI
MKITEKPTIGITSSIVSHNNIPSVNLHERYIKTIIQSGGIPIVIPVGTNEMSEVWVSLCDGIILSGGEDVDPYSYQEHPGPKIQKTNRDRDEIEIELVKSARKQNKPIFAICRGVTMLNVALGGTLIQDIETSIPNAINHYQQAERPEATHEVKIEESTRLYRIFNRPKIRVNSFHHQAIDKLAPSLKKVAIAPDGVIEAVEGIDESFLMLGVQWHPSELTNGNPSMLRLYEEFINECIK